MLLRNKALKAIASILTLLALSGQALAVSIAYSRNEIDILVGGSALIPLGFDTGFSSSSATLDGTSVNGRDPLVDINLLPVDAPLSCVGDCGGIIDNAFVPVTDQQHAHGDSTIPSALSARNDAQVTILDTTATHEGDSQGVNSWESLFISVGGGFTVTVDWIPLLQAQLDANAGLGSAARADFNFRLTVDGNSGRLWELLIDEAIEVLVAGALDQFDIAGLVTSPTLNAFPDELIIIGANMTENANVRYVNQSVAVPEPALLALLGWGLAGIGWIRRGQKR